MMANVSSAEMEREGETSAALLGAEGAAGSEWGEALQGIQTNGVWSRGVGRG